MKNIKKKSGLKVNEDSEITRREAMTRMGLAAFSAATMLLLLNKPEKAQAQDSSGDPDDPDNW